ncbi:bZIP transcription factor [Demequina capsici]|uniref:BZIP transcription factor n=1 Tax=Demequina capsici TaxID=3075620 RepID=A0AA96F8F3_9MICO|nr:bZIP transcription factor [Demequina sp. OYTSA14]WNM25174.1 bZIP transcription factor [Demequina sp. OYTSA14]
MADSRTTKAQLEQRLRELEAENEELQSRLQDRPPAPPTGPAGAQQPAADAPHRRGRSFLGATLIVIAAILAPLTSVASFAAAQVSDTRAFVATLAPLAKDPAVQALIVDKASTAIDDALDTDALVQDLLDSIITADSTPRLAAAADVLGPLLADQTRVAIRSALTAVVQSDAFASVWEDALTLTHSQLVSILEGDGQGAVAIDSSGDVVIQLQPILDALKPALVDQGFGLADSIPSVDVSITVTQVPQVATARLAYAILTTLGSVLPWLVLALLVVGVLVHPRRARAVMIAGSLMLVVGGTMAGLLTVVGAVAAAGLASDIPVDATVALYGGLTRQLVASSLAFALAGAIALLGGFLAGGSAAAASARRGGSSVLARGGSALDDRGWRSPDLARLLDRQGWLLWAALAAVFALCFALLRPLTPWDVVLMAVLLTVVALAFGVLKGDPASAPASDPAADPV